jgi:hypothetical protein
MGWRKWVGRKRVTVEDVEKQQEEEEAKNFFMTVLHFYSFLLLKRVRKLCRYKS